MNCPKCNSSRNYIKDTVNNLDTNETYRKRECADCGEVFYTVEFEAECNRRFMKDWHIHHRIPNKR